MKVRNSFVSNSSSQSFLIYGTEISGINEEELIELIKSNPALKKRLVESYRSREISILERLLNSIEQEIGRAHV